MTAKAVIFDMDGVLVDSYQPHYESWVISCNELGLHIDEEIYTRLFGQTFEVFAHELGGGKLSREQIDKWYWDKEALYREIIKDNFPANVGASDLLAELAASGFELAIGSSGPRENVACVIDEMVNAHLFKATVNGDEVSRGKPDPEVFLTAAKKLEVDPAYCVVVEDSIHGLQAAVSAGMKCVGITGTAPRQELAEYADIVVDCLDELSPESFDDLIFSDKCTCSENCE